MSSAAHSRAHLNGSQRQPHLQLKGSLATGDSPDGPEQVDFIQWARQPLEVQADSPEGRGPVLLVIGDHLQGNKNTYLWALLSAWHKGME